MACVALLGFVAVLNVLAYAMVRRDKRQALKRDAERIPERGFHMLALFGAGLGGALAMKLHRHKTRKPRFLVPYWGATLVGLAVLAGWVWLLCQ